MLIFYSYNIFSIIFLDTFILTYINFKILKYYKTSSLPKVYFNFGKKSLIFRFKNKEKLSLKK